MRAQETFRRLQTSATPWDNVLLGTLFCMGVCSAEVNINWSLQNVECRFVNFCENFVPWTNFSIDLIELRRLRGQKQKFQIAMIKLSSLALCVCTQPKLCLQ